MATRAKELSDLGNLKLDVTANGIEVVGVTSVFKSESYNILNLQTDTDDSGSSDDGIFKITNGAAGTTKAEFRWDESEDLVHVSYGDHGRHISIASDGNVGIGTSSVDPDLKLHVDGTNGYPASSGTTPVGYIAIRAKSTSSSHGANIGVANASPWGTWIQAQDANNLATSYPLLLNPNGGNVGIGSTSPNANLHINNINATATNVGYDGAELLLTGKGWDTNLGGYDHGWKISTPTAGYASNTGSSNSHLVFNQLAADGGSGTASPSYIEQMRISSTGNVGINNSTNLSNDLGTLLNVNNATVIGNNTSGAYFGYNARYDGAWERNETSGVGIISINTTGGLTYRTADSGDAGTEPSLTEIIRTGDNSQPSYLTLDGSDQVRLTLGNAGTAGTNDSNWIRGSAGQLGLNAASDNIHFEIAGSPKMELTTSGAVLPSNYEYNTVDGFGFYYPTGRMQLGFNYNSFGAEIILGNNRTASGETAFMQYRTNGVNEGTLVGNGSGFTISNVSDYRKKENITELANGSLARITNVRPVTYTLKEEYTNDTSKVYTGFIAHEFQEQFPNSVRGVKDELNEDGSVKLQSIDITSNELLTHLIKSIQEQQAQIQALQQRLDDLEG